MYKTNHRSIPIHNTWWSSWSNTYILHCVVLYTVSTVTFNCGDSRTTLRGVIQCNANKYLQYGTNPITEVTLSAPV